MKPYNLMKPLYISDHSDNEGDEVHWVSVFSAKAPPKVAESIVLSSDEDEEASDTIVAKKIGGQTRINP